MINAITQKRWAEAQAAEVKAVTYDDPEKARISYQKIFSYLGLTFDQRGKRIIEAGCGAFPAVSFCTDVHATIVEPLPFPQLAALTDCVWLRGPVEDLTGVSGDELWSFNCMQHVRDPELFIAKCKAMAPVVRFFEPVNYPTCVYHPHTFGQEDFERWFPGSVNRYTDRLEQFFDSDCVYGTWRADA